MGAGLAALPAAVGSLAFLASWLALGGRQAARGRPVAQPGGGPSAALLSALASLAPVVALRRRTERDRRRSAVMRELPTMLDVVTLGLSAGLSFDASLDLYCRRHESELASTMGEAMLSWRMGVTRRDEALRSTAAALDLAALRRFSDAVSQALAFGSPLASALEQQAQVIRDEQRSELEAEIERVPVKMLIPLGTLIVPAMLLAILGPLLAPSITGMT